MRSKVLTKTLIVAITVMALILLWCSQVWAQDDGAGSILEGEQLYRQYCVACHGEQGQGREGVTPALAQQPAIPEVDLKTAIRNGVPGTQMIAWSQENGGYLSDTDVDDLVAFILSLSQESFDEFEPTPTVTATPYPVPIELQGSSTGIVIGVFVVVLVVIIGVSLFWKRK